MKSFLALLFFAVLLCSCSNEIEDNSPAFQGVVDSLLFRSADSRAVFNDNGSLIIQGNSDAQTLNILINTPNGSSVGLGGDNSNPNIASYTDEFGNVFSTASSSSTGRVDYEINGDNTVSGRFNFVALRNGVEDTITLSQGFMFGIPILSALGSTPDVGTTDSFTARVNSVIFNPTIISSIEANLLTVSGQTQQASISVLFPPDTPPGTYDITADGDIRGSYILIDEDEVLPAQSGTLTIISNDTDADEVSGSFVFEVDGFSITDGGFSVSY